MGTKNKLIQVRVPPELAKQAKAAAGKQDRPLAQVIRDLLKSWLAGQAK